MIEWGKKMDLQPEDIQEDGRPVSILMPAGEDNAVKNAAELAEFPWKGWTIPVIIFQ